jgi:hypothetical protein
MVALRWLGDGLPCGAVTRDHADIEFFVLAADASRVRAALVAAGFVAPLALHPDEGQPYVKDGQEAGAWYLTPSPRGDLRIPGRWRRWRWPDGSFDGPPGRIGHLEAPVMSLRGLIEMKKGFATQPAGAALREKDRADLERLEAMLRQRRL